MTSYAVSTGSLKRLSEKYRLSIALTLATTLLIAQIGGQVHAYSHLRARPDPIGRLERNGRLCSECLSSASLLSPAANPSHLFAISPQGVVATPSVEVASLIARTPSPVFRSRAPPAAA
jgi:hypothetical protein